MDVWIGFHAGDRFTNGRGDPLLARDLSRRAASGGNAEASHNALTLKYLDGGHGKGCNEADDAFTLMRRRFHHFTFYGFMLCFAATVVATGYHYFAGWEAPYPFFSVPVMLGTLWRNRFNCRPGRPAVVKP